MKTNRNTTPTILYDENQNACEITNNALNVNIQGGSVSSSGSLSDQYTDLLYCNGCTEPNRNLRMFDVSETSGATVTLNVFKFNSSVDFQVPAGVTILKTRPIMVGMANQHMANNS